jgi:uncharacterized protein YktA (UPF0223 family)
MGKRKPTRSEINDVIKQFNNITLALEQRIHGLEFVLSEYFKFRGKEKKFEKYLKRKDDEKKSYVKESDAKVDGQHIQGGATDS